MKDMQQNFFLPLLNEHRFFVYQPIISIPFFFLLVSPAGTLPTPPDTVHDEELFRSNACCNAFFESPRGWLPVLRDRR
jgi:hypothetical protein